MAVTLFTPNHLYCSTALKTAKVGKPILCEKPVTMTVEERHQMIEAADAAKVKLMVDHKWRLRPQYAKIVQIVRSQRLGRVLSVNKNELYDRPRSGRWLSRKTVRGLLYLPGVHDIDFIRCICGEAGSVYTRSPI